MFFRLYFELLNLLFCLVFKRQIKMTSTPSGSMMMFSRLTAHLLTRFSEGTSGLKISSSISSKKYLKIHPFRRIWRPLISYSLTDLITTPKSLCRDRMCTCNLHLALALVLALILLVQKLRRGFVIQSLMKK